MKKRLLILFILSVIFYLPPFGGGLGWGCLSSLQAQTPGHKVDSIYVYNEKDSLIFMQEWEYDGSRVVNEVQYTWDKNGVKHGDLNTFKAFDDRGNNVLYVTLEWNDAKQDWVGRGRFEYIYGKVGTPNVKQFFNHSLWRDDQWTKDSTWTWQYNDQGLPILTVYQTFRNDQWQEQYKLIQDYDGSREIYHEEYSGRNANGLIGQTKWSQLYSGSTKISDRQYSWSGTEFVPKSWDTVGIVGGKTTLKESYVWTSGVQTGKSKEEWEFNTSGRQILNIKYSGWENGAFVPSTKQVDEWSGSTNTMTAKYNWDKTTKQWVGTTKTENITSDGYTIKKTYSGWANNDFVPSTIDSTKNENSKKVYYVKWTYSNGSWKGNSKEIYAYEGSNQTLQEKYSSWNNGWVGSNGNKGEQIWENNKVWAKVTYNWSAGWVPSVKDSTEYNGNDITFSVHYKYANGAWEGDNSKSNVSYTYLSAGQKEWTITLKWENNQWTNYIQTKSTYVGGKLAEERSQQWNNTTSAWQDVKVVYHTWENGVEVFTRTEEWDSATQSLKMTSEYKYVHTKDAQGRDQEEYKMKCGADSVWVGTGYTRTLWYYETRGDSAITSTVNYSWQTSDWVRKDSTAIWKGIAVSSQTFINAKFSWTGTQWQYTSLATNIYDEKGRAVSQDSKNYKSGKWTGVYWYYKEYDEWGNTISDVRYGAGSGSSTWRGTSRNDWGYDEFGNQTKKVNFRWNTTTEDWQITDQYDYLFDAKNRCTMSSHSFLAITGELVQDTYEEYFYLGNDSQPYSTLQYEYVVPVGEEAERWVVKQEDTYKYDDNNSSNKLREEIHGTWSKGVVVKYERTVYFYNDDPK